MESTLLYFVHIPKTAGSTLRQIFAQNFEKHQRLGLPGPESTNNFILNDNRSAILSGSVRLISGHGKYGALRDYPIGVKHFTFLRDPWDRLASQIRYIQKKGKITKPPKDDESIYQLAKEEYLHHPTYTDNILIRHVLGDLPNNHWVNEDDLSKAKEFLLNKFDSFYVTEYFDESVLMMAKRYRLTPPLYTKINVTKNIRTSSSSDFHDLRILKYDYELYNYAKNLFLIKIPQNSLFLNAKEEFQNLCSTIAENMPSTSQKEFAVKGDPIIDPDNFAKETPYTKMFISSDLI